MHKLVVPDGVEWELLVIDNCCTDNTAAVIAKHGDKLPLKRLFEPKAGLSNARNCGLAAATGDLILWTDDDVLVDRGWLAAYCEAAARWPQAAYFGGNIEPWFEREPARWIVENPKLSPFAERQLGSDVRVMNEDEYPFGANMAFRRGVLQRSAFDPQLGRVGDTLISGEELQVIQLLKARGLSGIWVGTACVKHFIPRQRLTRKYIWDFWVGMGITGTRRDGLPESICWFGMPRWLIRRHIFHRCRALWYRVTGQSNWAEEFHKAAISWGELIESRRSHRSSTAGGGGADVNSPSHAGSNHANHGGYCDLEPRRSTRANTGGLN